MFEKVNPSHVDKLCDRIAGAIVDLAYQIEENPRIAVEVLLGHGICHVIIETSVYLSEGDIEAAISRIAGDDVIAEILQVEQDPILADNQDGGIRCGDNGIFKGVPVTEEETTLSNIAKDIYTLFPYDGKYILDGKKLIICQSMADSETLEEIYPGAIVNPLGYWFGGPNVDTGATNRKLGSDMAQSVTGGGLCVSGDTQFISDDLKWHNISDYKAGQKVGQYNDGKLEFVIPSQYIQNESDNLLLFKNDSKLSMCLTPYHEVLVRTSKGNLVKHPALLVADSLLSHKGNLGKIPHGFCYEHKPTESKFADEADYRLQVAFCADGTMLNNQNKWSGRIRIKKGYKIERMRDLLKGKDYKESNDHEYSIFSFNPTVKSKSLYECFKDEDWTILKDEIYKWDGDLETRVFRTTIKEDADFIQFVLASDGDAVRIQVNDRLGEIFKEKYERKSVLYTVSPYASNTTELKENKGCEIGVQCIQEKQPSYCFTVPSHNLVLRHNDKVFITGNCGKDLSKADVSVNIYAFLKAQETGKVVELSCAIGDETIDGRPYEEIVEIARKYIQEKGGFEKFAEWGLV